jgi:hypothetical protein
MRLSVADVFGQLRAEGLAGAGVEEAAAPALDADRRDELPWFVRTAVGVGAWLATGFLLGGLFAISGLRGEVAQIIVGSLLIVAAVWTRRQAGSEFVRQAAVATSFAGQGLLIAGFAELTDSATYTGLILAALSAGLIWLMPDPVHRFLGTLVGVTAAAVSAHDTRMPYTMELVTLAVVAVAAYLWRGDLRARTDRHATIMGPVAYGLVIALFGLLVYGAFSSLDPVRWVAGSAAQRNIPGQLTTAGITIALLALVWKILGEHGADRSSPQSFAALAGVAALGASTLSSPGIIAGTAVLLLAFDRRNRVLLGLAIVFLLVFGSVYYYSLHLTLLEKSGVLAGSGALLIAIRQRIAPDEAKGSI